ncbi:PopZ family protein [Aureimonas ureilytica]|uniref:PopZ family protein n=1 Tax=Aureimonas ureilytica TaxID=401562 RepID=UPI003CE87514
MDEILASIRRIIETGEDRGAATSFRGGAASGRDPGLDAIRKEAEDVEPEDTNLSYLQRPSVALAPPRASDARTHDGVDEDHLTVQLESELAASWGEFETHHQFETVMSAAPVDRSAEPAVHAETASAIPQGETHAAAEPSQTDSREDVTMSETARHQPNVDRGTFEPANTDRRTLEEHGAYDAYAPTAGVDPLLSSSSGQMVAASFDELAQAIRNGELKSLEAMAQEMLKPMLAEWLDDNLPRMVERLVREEIERLSRGGRR